MAQCNRVYIINLKDPKKQTFARFEAARLWNDMVKLHKFIRKKAFKNPKLWKWPTKDAFEKHFKGKYNLHSQTIQALIKKFFANIDTIRQKRKNGDKKAKYPHRIEKYFNPIFKKSAIKSFGERLRLTLSPNNYLWSTIPNLGGEIVQAELGFNRLYLTISYDLDIPENRSTKIAGLDFGLIHTAVITDGVNDLAISGRGIRAIKQGHARNMAKIDKKIDKTAEGSKRNKKLKRKKGELIDKKENRLRDALHKVSRNIVDFCLQNEIKTLVVGNLEGINQNTRKKRRKKCNQEIGLMEFGRLYTYLEYKLQEQGIKLIKTAENYTTQTCPMCGHLNKPSSRNYRCTCCGYTGIRDLVGAYNIRNKYIHNGSIQPEFFVPNNVLKYIRPISMKKVSTDGKSCNKATGSSEAMARPNVIQDRCISPVPPQVAA